MKATIAAAVKELAGDAISREIAEAIADKAIEIVNNKNKELASIAVETIIQIKQDGRGLT